MLLIPLVIEVIGELAAWWRSRPDTAKTLSYADLGGDLFQGPLANEHHRNRQFDDPMRFAFDLAWKCLSGDGLLPSVQVTIC